MAFDERVAERVRRAIGPRDGIEERRMFGGLTFLLGGKMAIGVQGDELMVRVGKARHAWAVARPFARPMDFTGRPMEGYVYVAPAGFATPRQLAAWVDAAVENAESLRGTRPAAGSARNLRSGSSRAPQPRRRRF